jgi:hypothetical protein
LAKAAIDQWASAAERGEVLRRGTARSAPHLRQAGHKGSGCQYFQGPQRRRSRSTPTGPQPRFYLKILLYTLVLAPVGPHRKRRSYHAGIG